MSLDERLAHWTIPQFLEHVGKCAEALAFQAGVGAMETAGGIVSYLLEHPDDLEPFLNGGLPELPGDWYQRGCLTWHAQNGKIVHPRDARFHRIVKQMEPKP